MRIRASLLLGLFLLGGTAASASELLQYTYDARGRLVRVDNGTGYKTGYSIDAADNRTTKVVQNQFTTAWEAETLYHLIGYADGDGWAANTGLPANWLTYGPYAAFPVGSRVGTWRMLIDVRNVPDNSPVVTVDVWDATAGQQLASRVVTRHQWATDMTYQVFELPFPLDLSRAGHLIELRTFYHGAAYVRVDKIGVY